MNPLIGDGFEAWLSSGLTQMTQLKVLLYGTLMMVHPDTRDWKSRFVPAIRNQIVPTPQAFSKLR